MIVTVAAKIKMKPTQAQAEALLETISAYRKGCNLVSSVVFTTRQLKQPALHLITYNTLRGTIGLRSQMAQSVMKTVIARYKTNRSNGHDWTQVQFTSSLFSVNTLQGRIKVPFERKAMKAYFDGSWMFGTAKLVHKHCNWFLHIPMSKVIAEPQLEEMTQIVGIDLGINFLATAYDTQGKTTFFPGRGIKRMPIWSEYAVCAGGFDGHT